MKFTVRSQATYGYTNNQELDLANKSIVFLHGAGMDHTVWTLFARHFARHGHNVIALDLPGHGRSTGAPLTSIEGMSDWLLDVLDELALPEVAVVGHSMGSLITLDFASRYAERTRSAALVACTAPMQVSDAILDAARNNDQAAFNMLTEFGYSKRHLYGGNTNPGIWMVGSTLRLFERAAPGILYADMNACNDYQTGVDSAAKIECPVLVVLGADDRLTPERSTQALLEALPEPEVTILQGAGHTMMVEASNELLDALRSWDL